MLVTEVLKVVENLSDKRAQWLNDALEARDHEEVVFLLNGLHISPLNHNTVGHLLNHLFSDREMVFSYSGAQSVWYCLSEEEFKNV